MSTIDKNAGWLGAALSIGKGLLNAGGAGLGNVAKGVKNTVKFGLGPKGQALTTLKNNFAGTKDAFSTGFKQRNELTSAGKKVLTGGAMLGGGMVAGKMMFGGNNNPNQPAQ
jgi:hypothetical protein